MCGIAGIINFNQQSVDISRVRQMTNAMAHRGPDAHGTYNDDEVALGHLRLAIIDLSEAANQPFTDNTNRYVLIFNGEIYNYAEVKPLLPDYAFKTNSDTEMMVAAYAKWGPECIGYFRGMFAFAIWDKQEREMFVARDRMGVKPFYYFLDDQHFVFASEIRAVMASGLVPKKISKAALLEYFSFQSVSYPYSGIEGVLQLEAGSWMKIKNGKAEKKVYWDPANLPSDFDFSDKNRVQCRIRELLLQSVERRLVSDVPVGAFLSGGIDSSAVVGLMSEAGNSRPNTFTVSFDEKQFDESDYANLVAKKFNTVHECILIKPMDFLGELQNALDAMDSPSGDGINTYVVSKAIRRNGMTVALSGIGGDELFAGYPFFPAYLRLKKQSLLWHLPASVRQLAALGMADGRKQRMLQLLNASSCSIDHVYPIFRQILSPEMLMKLTLLVPNGFFMTSVQKELEQKRRNLEKLPFLGQFTAAELLGYTQHTLLKDTDQMSMANSLEVREPFFDTDLVEFVLSVPDKLKKPTYPKSLLVESIKPMLPDEIVFRKKQGFLFPWNNWLRNELSSFCETHIKNLARRSFIKGEHLLLHWQDFLKGRGDIRWPEIWLFVVLEYWMRKNGVE